MKDFNTFILTGILFFTVSLFAKMAMANSVYDLRNCTQADYDSAQKKVMEDRKAVSEGWMSKLEAAPSEVFFAEVALCAGKISQADACTAMMTHQQVAVGARSFEEKRRLIAIRAFCGK